MTDTEELKSLSTKVIYDQPSIRFVVGNKVVQERDLAELRRLIGVQYGDQWESEREFTVLDLGNCLWVVPNTSPLLFISQWADTLKSNQGYFRALIGGLPEAWRTKGFLGVRSWRPRAGLFPVESISHWNIEGPLDPTTGVWPFYAPVLPIT